MVILGNNISAGGGEGRSITMDEQQEIIPRSIWGHPHDRDYHQLIQSTGYPVRGILSVPVGVERPLIRPGLGPRYPSALGITTCYPVMHGSECCRGSTRLGVTVLSVRVLHEDTGYLSLG